jgi:hypothetical protein
MEDNKLYTESELIENIYFFSLYQILKTQKLSYVFVCDYILNVDFQLLTNEEKLTKDIVLNYQPHLKEEFNNNTKHLNPVQIDWPYFETCANE